MAIKKINVGAARAGVDVTSLREIKLLRELRSPYVVSLLDVFPHKRKLAMVRIAVVVMVVVFGVCWGCVVGVVCVKALKPLKSFHHHFHHHQSTNPDTPHKPPPSSNEGV